MSDQSQSSGPSLFCEDDIQRLVKRFYAAVRQDSLLGPVFASKIESTDAAWRKHERHIADFWSSIFLRTKRFTGNPMLKHAQIAGLTPEHFNHWLALFKSIAAQTLNADQAAAIETMANRIAQSLQMGLAVTAEQSGNDDHPFQAFSALRPSRSGHKSR